MADKLVFLLLSAMGVLALTFICMYLRRIVDASDQNRESIESISANMARMYNHLLADFVMKRDFDPLREKVEGLRDDVTELQVVSGIKAHPIAKRL